MNICNILKKNSFTQHLINLNRLSFNKWIFDPGMLFLSETKWWGDKGHRGHWHNGLDLRFYEAANGTIRAIEKDTRVPIIYDGAVVTVIKDFLGYSLFAAHEIYDKGSRLFTMYGHVLPSPDVSPGKPLGEGTEIAMLSGSSKEDVPGHLHLSVAFIPKEIPAEAITWELLDEDKTVRFFDPRLII